ncbi:hypothetical protein ACFQ7Z_09135 [Streptomyces virginiae]|uniref:hypothetical protein n=1 Tax=Streptomyces virginiae TaxID=1961 RepID=UPI0036B94A24
MDLLDGRTGGRADGRGIWGDPLPACPECAGAYAYETGSLLIRPECGHEWPLAAAGPGEAPRGAGPEAAQVRCGPQGLRGPRPHGEGKAPARRAGDRTPAAVAARG